MHSPLINRVLLGAAIILFGIVVSSFIWELPASVERAAPLALAGACMLNLAVVVKQKRSADGGPADSR